MLYCFYNCRRVGRALKDIARHDLDRSTLRDAISTNRMKKFTEFFTALAIAFSLTILTSSAVLAATNSAAKTILPFGTVFKIKTAPQVYYVAENKIAYGIPDEATFFSWFPSFNKIQIYPKGTIGNTVSKSILTIKPGARVVKFGTDPRLYTISKGARVRWIRDEETLRQLFGNNWESYLATLNAKRKSDYILGTDIKKTADFDRASERLGITPNDELIARKIFIPSKSSTIVPKVTITQLKGLGENSTSALQPAFSPFITSYRLNVPFREDKITITPSVTDKTLKISVAENEVVSGKGIILDAPLGSTNVSITVTSPAGVVEKYLLVINRAKPSENTLLNSLTENLSDTFSPKFSPNTRNYEITATGKENVITVVPKLASSLSKLVIDGQNYASGTKFQKGLVQGNNNVVQILVISESGIADRYAITIKKPN